ncbi:MAG TPA: BlaI/MecI/CopY family transcriptional regulator [Gemmatimonadales bacterium]|nr:BlaI/MecI/CopY family transcriptional regulator [Gemmatimonadales bacterium]
MPEPHQLTELQIAIMRILWERRQATVAEIHAALLDERGLAPTTVSTLLSRLEKRGAVKHRTVSRQYVYYPLISEEDVRASMVADLTEQLFDGDVAELVSHLLRARDMTPGDLEKVKELIATHEAGTEVSDEHR